MAEMVDIMEEPMWLARGARLTRYLTPRLFHPNARAARQEPMERLEFRKEFLPIRPDKLEAAMLVWRSEGPMVIREPRDIVQERRPDVLRALWRYCRRASESPQHRRLAGLIGQALIREKANEEHPSVYYDLVSEREPRRMDFVSLVTDILQ